MWVDIGQLKYSLYIESVNFHKHFEIHQNIVGTIKILSKYNSNILLSLLEYWTLNSLNLYINNTF